MKDEYLMESEEEGKRIKDKTNIEKTKEQLLKAGLHEGMSALDVGCASGLTTIEIARIIYPAKVIGVDNSSKRLEEAVELSKENGINNIGFVLGDVYSLPFQENSFDFVWNRFLMEYLKKPIDAITEMKRVVRVNGSVVSADLDGNCLFHYPIDNEMQDSINRIIGIASNFGFDPYVGRKLFHYYKVAGFSEIQPYMTEHHLIAGEPDASEKRNWHLKINTIEKRLYQHYPDKKELSDICRKFKEYIDSNETFTYSPLIIMKGIK